MRMTESAIYLWYLVGHNSTNCTFFGICGNMLGTSLGNKRMSLEDANEELNLRVSFI